MAGAGQAPPSRALPTYPPAPRNPGPRAAPSPDPTGLLSLEYSNSRPTLTLGIRNTSWQWTPYCNCTSLQNYFYDCFNPPLYLIAHYSCIARHINYLSPFIFPMLHSFIACTLSVLRGLSWRLSPSCLRQCREDIDMWEPTVIYLYITHRALRQMTQSSTRNILGLTAKIYISQARCFWLFQAMKRKGWRYIQNMLCIQRKRMEREKVSEVLKKPWFYTR